MKLPTCTGHQYWTDCGYEYDCDAVHEDKCDMCLASYKTLGGRIHPKTGKTIPKWLARILCGLTNLEKEQNK